MVAADHSSKSSKSANNIVELSSHMLAAICGGSEFCLQELQGKCHEHEKMEGRKPLFAEVSEWLSKILLAYKEEGLPIRLLITFYNEKEHGLYYTNDEGKLVKSSLVVIGAGSAGYSAVRTVLRRYGDSRISASVASYVAEIAYCLAASYAPCPGDNFRVYFLRSDGCHKVYEGDYKTESALQL